MIDEDLHVLHGILDRMEPSAKIEIGRMTCCAAELRVVVQEALAARQQRKIAEYIVHAARTLTYGKNQDGGYISISSTF